MMKESNRVHKLIRFYPTLHKKVVLMTVQDQSILQIQETDVQSISFVFKQLFYFQ